MGIGFRSNDIWPLPQEGSFEEWARLLSQCDRWTERTARLFCAILGRRAVEIELAHGRKPTKRALKALENVERFSREATIAELMAAGTATRTAVWEVAEANLRTAAWSAGNAVRFAGGTDEAAQTAADAAGVAERRWQSEQLMRIVKEDGT